MSTLMNDNDDNNHNHNDTTNNKTDHNMYNSMNKLLIVRGPRRLAQGRDPSVQGLTNYHSYFSVNYLLII